MGADKKNIVVGITSAYEIYPNEFKEAILANELKKKLSGEGAEVRLILINDDLDALTEVHLKRLIKQKFVNEKYKKYLNFPIVKIPAPNKKSESLSQFFLKRYLKKLKELGIIFDKVVNSSEMRKTIKFKKFEKKIINNLDKINSEIKEKFKRDFSDKLFRIFNNQSGYVFSKNIEGVEFVKFPWFIECLLRWEIYEIDYEFFIDNYLDKEGGSYYLSRYVCENLLSSKYAEAIHYTYIKFRKEIIDFYRVLPNKLLYEFIKKKDRDASSFNSLELEKILKNTPYHPEANKSYFEVITFLSYFSKEEISSRNFLTKFRKEFLKAKITRDELQELFSCAKEYNNQPYKCERNNELAEEVHKGLKIISLSQKSKLFVNLEEFKLFARNYLNDFSKTDFIWFNRLFYNSERGIPITTYLYFKPEEKVFLEVSKIYQ